MDKGDPIVSIDVKKELKRRIQHVREKFGDNQLMADKVLSYPDDSYVFYKTDPQGRLLIRLTAWGYRHPVKIDGTGAGGMLTPQVKKEPVSFYVTYGGKPMGGKAFKLNGMPRKTDAKGSYEVGPLPLGYEFDVEINGTVHHVVVTEGMGPVTFDATVFADLEVRAILDGQPYVNAQVMVSYGGQQLRLVTDGSGCASAQLPLNTEGQQCSVTIDAQSQMKPLSETTTSFTFDFVTPQPEPEPIPEPVPDPIPQPEPEPIPEPVPDPISEPEPIIPDPDPNPEPEPEPIPEPEPPMKHGGILPALLFGLGLALLVALTYYVGLRLL